MLTSNQQENLFAPTSGELEQFAANLPATEDITQAVNHECIDLEMMAVPQLAPTQETEVRAGAGKTTPKAVAETKKKSLWNRLATIVSGLFMVLASVFTCLVLVLAIGPRFLPYQVCSVLSGSMEPTLPVGSIVFLVKTDGNQLKVGDIITFNHPLHPNQLVTHRIYQVKQGPNGPAFVTKGDANNTPDSWVVNGSGTGWHEVFSIPYLGYILGAMSSPLAQLFILGIPAIILSIILLVEIWSPRKPEVVGV